MSTGLGTLQRSVFNVTPMLEQVFMGNRTEFECWEQGEYRITPFNNAPQGGAEDKEYNLPENLTILTPQGHEGEKLSLARKFAEEYGVQYQEGVFLHENAQYTGDCVFGESTVSAKPDTVNNPGHIPCPEIGTTAQYNEKSRQLSLPGISH